MSADFGFQNIIGRSDALNEALALARRVAAAQRTTVLLLGETGVGKELFARGIHYAGATSEQPFVAVNCAAIPETLLESELFGHERGAFTDARKRKSGLFELAGTGTIFLDEIHQMPLSLQPKLLRVLESRRVRLLGGSEEVATACRVIAASSPLLEQAVASGAFREDLYYRLNVFTISLPPLRERKDDITLIARHCLAESVSEHGRVKVLSPAALEALHSHRWPGNVRELRNVIERAAIISGDERTIQPEHLLIQRRSDSGSGDSLGEIRMPRTGKTLAAIERDLDHQREPFCGGATPGNLAATPRAQDARRARSSRPTRSVSAATPARGETRAGAPDARAVVAALMEEARSAAVAGRRAVARQRYESALYLLRDHSDGATASTILRRVGRLYLDDGDIAAGMDCLTAALAAAEARKDADECAHTINVMAISYWQRGMLDDAQRLYLQALHMARIAGDARLVAMVEQNLGVIASMHGDVRLALEHYHKGLAGYRELGMTEETALLLNNIGMAYVSLDQWAEAAATYAEARQLAQTRGMHLTRLMVDVNRVALLVARHEYDPARELCDDVIQDAEELNEKRILAEAHKHRGVIARETRHLPDAEQLFAFAYQQAIEREDLLLAAETAREQAELYLALGRNRDTLKALSLSHRLFSQLQARRDLADVSRRLRLLEQRFEHLVGRYAQNIESKDAYTLGHCQRVADLACSIATDYGFDQPTMFWFRVGALLHDVGKVVVPSDILNKPGSLSPEERAIMERHPVAGVELLHDVEFPWDVIPMIRGHHERWDGHGYPDGLAGEDIPLPARILCVADVFDALTSQRPYRQAFSPHHALQLMQADAGRHFDPEILARFLRVVTELPENETRMAEATRVASIA